MYGSMLTTLIFGLLVTSPAFAISRVGTCGVYDSLEGFQVKEMPEGFRDIRNIGQGGVLTRGVRRNISLQIPGNGIDDFPFQEIRIFPIRFEYPELIGLGRSDVNLVLSSRGAQWDFQSVPNPQLLILSTVNTGLRTTIVAWGRGIGIVIHSALNPESDQAVQHILTTIEVEPRGMQW